MNTAQAQSACPICGGPVTNSKYYTRTYCSVACRNTANAKHIKRIKGKTCPVCGHVGYDRKTDLCAKHLPKRNTQAIKDAIRARYQCEGAKAIAAEFGVHPKYISGVACNMGLKLDPSKARELSVAGARNHMTNNNPMFRPETRAKVAAWVEANPDVRDRVLWALHEGQHRQQKRKVSSAERRLQRYLMELGVSFEPAYPFARNRFADARIGRLVIQCDGEYWHGHPRFEPLTDRQKLQRGRDRESDAILESQGFTVVRIWESELTIDRIRELMAVHKDIILLDPPSSDPAPSRQ